MHLKSSLQLVDIPGAIIYKAVHLQARGVAEGIIASVALMKDSGLPCFGRGQPVDNLRRRFRLELNDAQAAAFMRATIADAYDKVCPVIWHCSI